MSSESRQRCPAVPLAGQPTRWARLLWTVLLLLHIPLVVSCLGRVVATPSAADVIRVVAVGLTVTFFALKLVGVPWLRLAPGWRAWAAATVCVLLLHADVIRRNQHVLMDQSPDALLVAMTTAGGLTTLAGVARLLVSRVEVRRPRHVRAAAHAVVRSLRDALLRADLPPRFLMLARGCAVHRAPPVLISPLAP